MSKPEPSPTMTVEKACVRARDLRMAIASLIREFQVETGLVVERVELTQYQLFDGTRDLSHVTLEVRLP